MLKIFISYKRRDYNLVRHHVSGIEKETGAACWLDLAKIETSEQFASVICRAIDDSDCSLPYKGLWPDKLFYYTQRGPVPASYQGTAWTSW